MPLLYDVPLSPFAQKVKLAFLEKGIAFETRVPTLGAPEPDFLAASPRGEVPALVDGDSAIFESSVILEYIEDKWPQPALRPAGAAARARCRMLQSVCDTQFEAINWALTEVRVMRRAEGDLAAAIVGRAKDDLSGLQAWLARELGPSDWFGGRAPDLTDIVVFPYVMTATFHGFGPAADSSLGVWRDRMRARDSAARVLTEAKAALKTVAPDIRAKALSGERPRQYRDHRLEFILRSGGMEIVRRGVADGTIRFSKPPK